MRRLRWVPVLGLGVVFAAGLFFFGLDVSAKKADQVEIVILSTTDTNGELEPCG